MSSGSKKQVVGYRYYLGVHMILCHGPVDQVSELIVGERTAWTGNVTGNATIGVNAPELFGGESREGGVVGVVDIEMGGPLQAVNAYLNSKISGAVPAYRGLVGAIFRGGGGLAFQWSAMNPYFKAPWWRVKRVLKGWNSDIPWYPEKAAIGAYDMNPAHIIYECLTNNQWGMGGSPVDIDDANFRAVADRLHAEGFGLSCMWMDQTSIGDFIDEILRHVDGRRRYDVKTGKLQIHLMRDDYNITTLPELNESNIVSVESFQRSTWGEMTNEIIVKYTNRNQKTVSVSVQNLAGIEAQGGVVSVTRDYFAIRETALANRVAMRDLHSMSTPLAKITLSCNRVAWDWVDGDLFKLNWPSLGINGVPFRVSKIDKGTLLDGTIKIEAVEDIFQMPSGAYTEAGESGWEKPDLSPKPLLAQRAIEAPYWDVVQSMSAADIDYLPESWAFGEVLGSYDSVAYNFNLMHSTTSGGTYSQVGTGHFVPSGTLVASMGKTAGPVTFSITGSTHLHEAEVGNYAYIDNEIFAITAINFDTETITADRGVLDSVPAKHAAGARIYFVDGTQGVDQTKLVSGETAYYKALPVSGAGALPLGSAAAMSLALTGRAHKPYPPGNVKINGKYFPTNAYGTLTTTWAHRDRLQQTVSLTPFTDGNIGPEAGTTYGAAIYGDNDGDGTGYVLRKTESSITATAHSYTQNDEFAVRSINLTPSGGFITLPKVDVQVRVELQSARDSYTSSQKHAIVVRRPYDLSVKSRTTTAPPASPAKYDAYLVPAAATGAWSDHTDHIAVYDNSTWVFANPTTGNKVYVENQNKMTTYATGTGWDAGVAPV